MNVCPETITFTIHLFILLSIFRGFSLSIFITRCWFICSRVIVIHLSTFLEVRISRCFGRLCQTRKVFLRLRSLFIFYIRVLSNFVLILDNLIRCFEVLLPHNRFQSNFKIVTFVTNNSRNIKVSSNIFQNSLEITNCFDFITFCFLHLLKELL